MKAWARFKQLVSYIPGTVHVYQLLMRRFSSQLEGVPHLPLDRGPLPAVDFEQLQITYQASRISQEPDSFVLYRIIGNDLVPRHRKGQSRENLRFILENEPQFPNCEKRFVLNRVVDPQEEAAIITMLEDAGFAYLHLPFSWQEYETVVWDIHGVPSEYAPYTKCFAGLAPAEQKRILMRICRHKNNYVMHNNGARNAALEEGKKLAKWVLPFDGNCFITQKAWQGISDAVYSQAHIPYFVVPMARVTENNRLLDPLFSPEPIEEPQILFRRDTELCFNANFYYGRRPKVELLWRLAVPGDWDNWRIEPWDLPGPEYVTQAGCFAYAGWVARLNSGQANLELDPVQGKVDRGLARNKAISSLLDHLDTRILSARGLHYPLLLSCPAVPEESRDAVQENLLPSLLQTADQALQRGPYSVIDKTSLAPSNDPHDYWHPAPYYWPNPLKPSGLPYVSRDGQRVPGTRLYEPESDKYDRTRLQRLFDDTLVLALAWQHLGDKRFAEHASLLVRTWFLSPETAMNPNLNYSQVRMGHNRNMGNSSGIIEMKDLYFFLDAVRILQNDGFLSTHEQDSLKKWFTKYLYWLQTRPQGQKERSTANNHGLYFDLQVASIAAFLGETLVLRDTLRDSHFRILQHFDAQGYQPHEMKRTITAHYCCFNLQGWIHLAQLAEAVGEDLWCFEGQDGQGIKAGMHWLLSHLGQTWPYEQIETFDYQRFYPIYYACRAKYGLPSEIEERAAHIPVPADIKPLFYPHDGIRPFWQLRL